MNLARTRANTTSEASNSSAMTSLAPRSSRALISELNRVRATMYRAGFSDRAISTARRAAPASEMTTARALASLTPIWLSTPGVDASPNTMGSPFFASLRTVSGFISRTM